MKKMLLLKRDLAADDSGNYSGVKLTVGQLVYKASDPYGCCRRGEAVGCLNDTGVPYFELPADAVEEVVMFGDVEIERTVLNDLRHVD